MRPPDRIGWKTRVTKSSPTRSSKNGKRGYHRGPNKSFESKYLCRSTGKGKLFYYPGKADRHSRCLQIILRIKDSLGALRKC
jgi:hypothetical protein